MTRDHAYHMLLRVNIELEAARFALSLVLRDWHLHLDAAPTPFGRALSHADLSRCRANLEITYILRLFGTWEAVLRDYWSTGLRRQTDPDLKPLVDSLATRRNVDPGTIASIHDLRAFRNEIVHENLQVLRYDYSQVARALSTFVSYLPINW